MKARLILCLLLSVALSPSAQEFIGCRTADGWAETPMLRKTFTVTPNTLKHYDFQTFTFSIDVTSLGYHYVYVNSMQVGDHVMQPAVSQLDKRALTVTYDITDYIQEGENEIMLWLGQGWGRIYGTHAAARAEVNRTVSDGECGEIWLLTQTDSTWEATPSQYSYTGSWQPMQFGGERYDARVQEDWRPATVYPAEGITISRQEFNGNRYQGYFVPVAQTVLKDGTILLDFGRVVTGWFQAQMLPIPEGNEVTMEYLDHIDAKPPFTETDIYISDGRGDDDMHFTNRFHMHAFRYVKIRGLEHYALDSTLYNIPVVIGNAVHISAVDPDSGATFECSDPRLNAIHDMVKYTLSCLTFSGYMVDCPHIERMGYGGDGNSSTMTLQTLWDVCDTYRNWLTAWGDAIDITGDLPYVAPAFRTGGGPYWSGFIIKAPWRTYLNYGDRSLIVQHYSEMCRWLEFVKHHCKDGILQPWPDTERRSWFLGDWAVPEGVDKGGESVLHVSNCFLAECLSDMTQIARLCGRSADAEHFEAWRQRLVADIHRHFYHHETHTYANGTPLDQTYALLQGIPPDSTTAAEVKVQLIKNCHVKYRDHIAVGLVGVPVFTEWCILERQADLMATILRQSDYPGYLNMMDKDCVSADAPATNTITQSHNNAFTTWESWDCGRPGKEDRSRVHNCYNGIGIWFYQALAGIRPDPSQPGYRHFFIDPQPCDGVEWVRATKPTPYGDIKVEINYEFQNTNSEIDRNSKFEILSTKLKLTVPQGTTATVFPGTPNQRTLPAGTWQLSND